MTGYDIVFVSLLIYSALFLFTLGWMGIISQTPMVHRCPYTFHRPTVYILILGLLFLDSIVTYFGEIPALIVFVIIVLDILYETIHPFISHSVEIESATPESIRTDLIDAFQKLSIRYQGKYPKFKFPDEKASLKVKYWPKLSRGMLIIYPRAKMDLLLKIVEIVEKDFDAEEGKADLRGYVGNIFVAFALFIFALWQFLCKSCGV